MGWEDSVTEPIPPGQNVELVIAKVAQGKPTSAGDRQLRIVLQDLEMNESLLFVPIEGKARFRLSQLFHGLGHDSKTIDLDPEHLAIQSVAEHWLKGKTLRADVTVSERDPKYREFRFIDARNKESASSDGGRSSPPAVDVTDAPF